VEFGILGPLTVSDGAQEIEVRGAKQRVLLAALLVERGRVVSADRLAELLWPDEPPANPRNALQSQVSQLRRALGEAGRNRVVARPPGYLLALDHGALDAARFEELVAEARASAAAGRPADAARSLADGLRLWRGPALSEFADLGFAGPEATRLEQLRLTAVEERLEAELATGRSSELVPELETLVAAHPLRERLRGHLMLALYRAGRQADALEAYHDARRVLDEELGIDPGPELTNLYESLLRHDVEATELPQPRAAAPPVAAVASLRPGHVPAAFSSFVGREDDLRRVRALVSSARLVTLTGPGGVGKTRLAVEAAARLQGEGAAAGGVWFVELAAIDEPSLLEDVVAQALGLADDGFAGLAGAAPRETMTRLSAALRDRGALLVLDNCEHLVEATAAFVRELLSHTSALTVLCTSREPLGLTGEAVWSVPSLHVPPEATVDDPEELRRWGAVRLFVDRAQAADPGWVLDQASAPAVVEICRRLDGIALALELAAARVRTLGLAVLAERLEDRFRVLAGGDRTAQPRQRTLRAVVDWSWELLDVGARAVFRRLSVFASGATIEAAEAVCSDGERVRPEDVLDLLAGLADRSMIIVDHSQPSVRYRMLETLRAYGHERLREAGEWDDRHHRHAAYLLEVVRHTVPLLRGREQLDAMQRLDTELDDLRGALRWLDASGAAQRGARLATELGWYWYLRGLRVEGLRWMRTFEEAAGPREAALTSLWCAFLEVEGVDPEQTRELFDQAIERLAVHGDAGDRAFAQLLAADLSAVVGDHAAVPGYLAAARRAADEAGDAGYQATADFVAGHQQLMSGDFAAAQPWIEAALEGFRAVGDRWGQVQCLMALASDAGMSGDLEVAVGHVDDALDLSRQLHLRELEGILHGRRATLAALGGDLTRAMAEVVAADRISDELGADFLRVNGDLAAGLVALRRGDLDTADRRLREALRWLEDSPNPLLTTYALARLSTVAELRGQVDEAVRLAQEAVRIATVTTAFRSQAVALDALAAAYAARGRTEDAALLLGAVEARREGDEHGTSEADVVEARRAERAARSVLGDHVFAELTTRGRGLGLDELPLS
jgi:predicted ATPase/DNA-binding SARP family transcriptional activator